MKHISIFLLILSLVFLSRSGDLIKITEIMKNPAGKESECPGGDCHEYIEFMNMGSDTLFIENLFLTDGSAVDSVVAWSLRLRECDSCKTEREFIAPGETALILDREYRDTTDNVSLPISGNPVLLTVDHVSIAGGLTSTGGVLLYKGTKDRITDSLAAVCEAGYIAEAGVKINHEEPPDAKDGWSLVPRYLLFENSRYMICPDSLTPGYYEKEKNGWITEKKMEKLPGSDTAGICSVAVAFTGGMIKQGSGWFLYRDKSSNAVDSGIIKSTGKIQFISTQFDDQSYSYEFRLYSDHDTLRETINVSSLFHPDTTLIINEIFPRATAAVPEWIELVNISETAVNIKNWRTGNADGADTITNRDIIVKPYDYLIITRDRKSLESEFYISCAIIEPANWQSLDNYRDTLMLWDNNASEPCEKIYYDNNWFDSWEKESVERVSSDKNGLLSSSWILSQRPSPGQPNFTALTRTAEKPGVHIGPVIFTPNRDRKDDSLNIDVKLPAGYSCDISIYSFEGIKLAEFNDVSGQGFRWDGKTSGGKYFPVGPFFVVAKFRKGENVKIIRKKGVLWR